MLSEFEYRGSVEWKPLPDWARYFWSLGEEIGKSIPSKRLVTVASVPTRDFVAAFAATGFLSTWSLTAQLTDPNVLPAGTHLFVPYSGELRLGVVTGRTVLGNGAHDSHEMVRVELRDRYHTVVYLCPGKTHRLIRTTQKFSAGSKQRARPPRPTQLCDAAMHGDPEAYQESESLDCVFIGNPVSAEGEIKNQQFRPRNLRPGTLGDIIRAKEFSPGEPWHTRIISSRVRTLPELPGRPALVVFDGARTFRKWRLHFPTTSWFVVLDRSDPEYANTLQVVDEEYGNRVRTEVLGPPPPPGIEVTSFEGRP